MFARGIMVSWEFGPQGRTKAFILRLVGSVASTMSSIIEPRGFDAICECCGADFRAPGNCKECGMAFHF